MDDLRLNNQLCFPIYALSRQITALYRPHLEKLGLTYPQYLVMLVLWEHKTICVNDIGKLLWLDSGTLTPLLKRMEEHGLAKRIRCKEDERKVLVHISEKGGELKKQASVIPEILKKELESKQEQVCELKDQFSQLLSIITTKCKSETI